jgi:hypothetical protein
VTPAPGDLVSFVSGELRIAAQVIAPAAYSLALAPGQVLCVDAHGELYDPAGPFEPVAGRSRDALRMATDAQLRAGHTRRRLRAMAQGPALVRLRRCRVIRVEQRPGKPTILPAAHPAMQPLPWRLTKRQQGSALSLELEWYIVLSIDTARRRALKQELRRLHDSAPLQAEAYQWVFLGGLQWTDGATGRVLACPIRPSQLAAMRGVSLATVCEQVAEAHRKLCLALGWDPRDYCHPLPDYLPDADAGVVYLPRPAPAPLLAAAV